MYNTDTEKAKHDELVFMLTVYIIFPKHDLYFFKNENYNYKDFKIVFFSIPWYFPAYPELK